MLKMKLLVEKKRIEMNRNANFSENIDRSDISVITVMRVSAISSMTCSRQNLCQTSTDSTTINFNRYIKLIILKKKYYTVIPMINQDLSVITLCLEYYHA